MVAALVTLLHVLVFVYWLGGDLGAFYTSSIVSDPTRPPAARIAAAQALANLDMAPRTALILALPTGLWLAAILGWAQLPAWGIALAWAAALVWLWLAWRIHLKHLPPTSLVRRMDLAIRWLVLASLLAAGAAILVGVLEWPLFVGMKMLVLAAAIATGLWVRALLAPFGPAFAQLAGGGPTPQSDAAIARSLARVRPAVLLIWLLLLAAAFLGAWRPA